MDERMEGEERRGEFWIRPGSRCKWAWLMVRGVAEQGQQSNLRVITV